MTTNDRCVHQAIHPSVRPLLDPEYVEFHDQYYQYLVPDDQKVWDGSARVRAVSVPSTESVPVAVGSIRDIDLGNYNARVFTPEGVRPDSGWPVFLWFHGGGWAVGDVGANNDLCALVCQRAECVVVTVGYRLAPENPFPAAFDDCVGALRWVHSQEGVQDLGINPSNIGVGGISAGGQLATSLSMKAATLEPPIALAFQLLIVPVIDNTATASTVWRTRKDAPWLTPARMQWYRRMYLVNEEDAKRWEASPNHAPKALLAKSPKTWIAVAEQDLLSTEALLFAKQLNGAWEEAGSNKDGLSVELGIYKGATHSILAMSGMFAEYLDFGILC
ncbi:hypothetical protein S7711_06137 [Stachybotrys chartarum IBT 7711]|uniref:Alpha/beta hydrolase fold-3 domain-containing protein n=1 Tax=Stachybotrys chartarum (strain CBS 109288 / IBT 7711) TaxID=1280523 RepID=A0A084B686_STACB|nr:hypothetical protein S7711_06137 [Stachybotrys chartarum IBT 7711]